MHFPSNENEADSASGSELEDQEQVDDGDMSSDLESPSEDDEGQQSPNVITQRDVFGSDTESGGNASPISDDVNTHAKKSRTDSRKASTDDEHSQPSDSESDGSVSPRVQSNSSGVQSSSEAEDSKRAPQKSVPQGGGGRLLSLDDESDIDEGELAEDARRSPDDDAPRYQDDEDHGQTRENEEEQEEEEDDGHEPDETRIAVDFPLIRADLGKEMHLVKMPNFLSVETRPFDPNFYEDELDEDEVLDEEGRTRLKLKVENTIRWRIGQNEAGETVHESNARIVRWSDGSLSLHLGDEIFDIHKLDIHADYNYLFIREGSGLQGQSSLRTKLTFRPHSTDSFTHRKITLSLADKNNKSQKVKILPVAGADPESNRLALIKREEEKLRVTLRRESRIRRLRERQAMNRSSFGGGSSSGRRHYAGDEEDDDDEDDVNSTSINALKRKAKSALAASRKDVAAIYSSESDSLSDISEPRKKVRAHISDEEESA